MYTILNCKLIIRDEYINICLKYMFLCLWYVRYFSLLNDTLIKKKEKTENYQHLIDSNNKNFANLYHYLSRLYFTKRLNLLDNLSKHTRGARIYRIRIVADRLDPVTIEGTIGRDGYLVYLVISGHKNDHKPTRFIPVKVMRARTSSLARTWTRALLVW